MSRPPVFDHRPKSTTKPVGLARIKDNAIAGVISCSCGRDKSHRRAKVREDWASKHVRLAHAGRAIWL